MRCISWKYQWYLGSQLPFIFLIDYKGHLEASIANIMGVTQQQLLLSIFLLVLLILVLSPEGYSLVRLLVPALPPSSTFVGLFFCCWQISIQEWFIPVMSDSKARATLDPLSADVSRQFNRCCIRKSSMASCFTSLLSAKSDLLPMRVTQMEGSAYCWISFSQLGKFSKVLALVRSKTITAPTVFLQQLEAMARKRSWPAVSQIWFWMVLPSMCSTLVDSSTPMVALELSWKELLRYLERRLVLPTPESPTMTSLKRQSISSEDIGQQRDQN